jgi:hypothetical protein
MASCMVSRSNRFCVRICVPDPALVCLQVAFGVCVVKTGAPFSPNRSGLSLVAAREQAMLSSQICSPLGGKPRKGLLKSSFKLQI